MKSHPYELIDVFTDQPLAGNQLAVFPHGEDIDELLLQPLARELNLAETVFLYPPEADGQARMRIFTAWCEVPFAGHPVLGTACLLARAAQSAPTVVDLGLETGKGIVAVKVEVAADGSLSGWMDQPIPVLEAWTGIQGALLKTLNIPEPVVPIRLYNNGILHLYVMLPSVADVLAIEPDFSALREVCAGARINCFAGAGSEYTSRMFTPFDPAFPEDPACGSAAGPLAVHLIRHGVITSGQEITIAQGEKVNRPSTLRASATAEADAIQKVQVGGSCYLIGQGSFFLP
ncbi:MAG: 2,3-dihydro-3-hydroxyanthranilate isomerase [Acidimicrobiales bacterium]|nr:MAG: 2,3-dihydro-3-hydroxyanthranilate isomerase [Acidimicrobiales bacterium]